MYNHKLHMREYTAKNRDDINKRRRDNYQKNKPKLQKLNKLSYQRNRVTRLLSRKNYRELHHGQVIEYNEKYRRSNLGKFLEYAKKYIKTHELPNSRILQNWSNFIKSRDQICKLCGAKAEEAHHIIHRAKYPELALNENNGIALCKKCHYEVHGRFA